MRDRKCQFGERPASTADSISVRDAGGLAE